jgi:MATE family multidrug resistance protein
LQDVKIPSLYIFISYWIIGLPLGYYLAFKANMGAIGIWSGLLIGLTLVALALFLRLRSLMNKRELEAE